MSTYRQRNAHGKPDADEDESSSETPGPSYDEERAQQPKLRKSQRWQAQTLVVAFINFALFFSLGILYIYQTPIHVEITADETRLIEVNPFLYKRIDLSDKTGELKTYLFSDVPTLTKQSHVTLKEDFTIPKDHYKYWARYFNAGSKATFSLNWIKRRETPYNANARKRLNAAPSLVFCLHKGDLNSWLAGGRCEIEIDTADPLINAEYEIESDASYYFIVENRDNPDEGETDTLNRLTKAEEAQPMHSIVPLSGVGVRKRTLAMASPKETARPLPFYFITGNVSFQLTLVNYDVSTAEDLFEGSFIKDYDYGTKEWLVVSNPLKTTHLSFTYTLTLRISTLFFGMIAIELVLFGSYFIPRWLRKVFGKKPSVAGSGIGNVKTTDTSWYKSFKDTHGNYFKKRQRSNIRVNVPKEEGMHD